MDLPLPLWLLKKMLPDVTFTMAPQGKTVFLTFDDGPHPDTTPQILEILDRYNAKATFFCLGKQAEKYPQLVKAILYAGHATGNHSYSHPNGWLTGRKKYIDDIEKASALVPGGLFRPPYGRITPGQYLTLKNKYRIIMWTRQFADYKKGFVPSAAAGATIAPGDILVLHDSQKTAGRTLPLLDLLLKRFEIEGFICRSLNMQQPSPAHNKGSLIQ